MKKHADCRPAVLGNGCGSGLKAKTLPCSSCYPMIENWRWPEQGTGAGRRSRAADRTIGNGPETEALTCA